MCEQIDTMTRDAEFGTAGEHQEILATYKMFAYGEGWSRRINEAIDSGLTAEAAIERVQQRTRARMREIDDPILKERMHDLEDLSNRLLRLLTGRSATAVDTDLPRDTLLIARTMGPAELLDYDRKRVRGLVLSDGGVTGHVAIVAKAPRIPGLAQPRDVVGGVGPGRPDAPSRPARTLPPVSSRGGSQTCGEGPPGSR